jgi:hypothetical protein
MEGRNTTSYLVMGEKAVQFGSNNTKMEGTTRVGIKLASLNVVS